MIAKPLRSISAALVLGWFGFIVSAAGAEPGNSVIRFSIKDTTGISHPAIEPGMKGTVWLFISHDCPISNGYAPEIVRIAKKYSAEKISFRLVYAESGLSAGELASHAAEHDYPAPLFADESLALVKKCGVIATPEVVVLDATGKPVYRGRIDDRYWAPGRERAQTSRQDLREALDDLLAGRAVRVAQTTPVGCYLTQP